MLDLKKISEVFGLKVFTDDGKYFGEMEEAVLDANRVFGWKIRASRESFLSRSIGGAKGVIIQHPLIRAIGDIVIVSNTAIPSSREERPVQEESPF